MSASKFNLPAVALWVLLAPAPFVFVVMINLVAIKAPGTVVAYSLVPYALGLMFAGSLIRGRSAWRSVHGLIRIPFLTIGLCGLSAILVSAIIHGM